MVDLDDELIGFTGDVSLHGDLPADLFEPLAQQIRCRLILSYESVLAPPGLAPASQREKIVLLAPDDRLGRLAQLNIAAVCVANNHISDFGDASAQHTIDRLSALWQTFGAGRTPDHFHRTIVSASQTRIALAAYCLSDTTPLHATETRIGPRDFSDELFNADQVWARQRGDHFVVLLHWGDVHTHYPRPDQLELARSIIDRGADLIIGAHSHTVQGYEQHRGRYIFYGLGNLRFADLQLPLPDRTLIKHNLKRNRQGLLPVFRFKPDRIELDALHHLVNTHVQPTVTNNPKTERQLNEYSRWLSDPEYLTHYNEFRTRERSSKRNEETLSRRWRQAKKLIGLSSIPKPDFTSPNRSSSQGQQHG